MGYITRTVAEGGDILTGNGNNLTDDLPAAPGAPVFPLMLLLRLFIHATWLLFMLVPS